MGTRFDMIGVVLDNNIPLHDSAQGRTVQNGRIVVWLAFTALLSNFVVHEHPIVGGVFRRLVR